MGGGGGGVLAITFRNLKSPESLFYTQHLGANRLKMEHQTAETLNNWEKMFNMLNIVSQDSTRDFEASSFIGHRKRQ